MNERIKELAEQSQKIIIYTDGGYTANMVLDEEKFAELILRDCLSILKEEFTQPLDWMPSKSGIPPEKYLIMDRIEKHFGIE
jgi:hypothetical protein